MTVQAELIRGNWFDIRGYQEVGRLECLEYDGWVVIVHNNSDHYLVGLQPRNLEDPEGKPHTSAMYEESFCYEDPRTGQDRTRYAYLQACLLAARIAATH